MRGFDRDLAQLLGENLRRLRKRTDMSQEELSFRADLHRTAVGNLERGAQIPRSDTVIRLAGALDVPVGDLLANVVWRPVEVASGGYRVRSPEGKACDREAGR